MTFWKFMKEKNDNVYYICRSIEFIMCYCTPIWYRLSHFIVNILHKSCTLYWSAPVGCCPEFPILTDCTRTPQSPVDPSRRGLTFSNYPRTRLAHIRKINYCENLMNVNKSWNLIKPICFINVNARTING